MSLDGKLNLAGKLVSLKTIDLFREKFENDPITLAFYFVLKKNVSGDNFEKRCIRASKDIGKYGYPNSTSELKEITDLYFKGELDNPTLRTLLYYIQIEESPEFLVI